MTLEAQVDQIFLGCKCPMSRGIFLQEQDPLGDLPHVQIFINDEPNPLTWYSQLLSYWFSRNPAVFEDSVVRHREVGWAKDLSAPPRNMKVCYVLLYDAEPTLMCVLCRLIKNNGLSYWWHKWYMFVHHRYNSLWDITHENDCIYVYHALEQEDVRRSGHKTPHILNSDNV
jgi:hypothetical protein